MYMEITYRCRKCGKLFKRKVEAQAGVDIDINSNHPHICNKKNGNLAGIGEPISVNPFRWAPCRRSNMQLRTDLRMSPCFHCGKPAPAWEHEGKIHYAHNECIDEAFEQAKRKRLKDLHGTN